MIPRPVPHGFKHVRSLTFNNNWVLNLQSYLAVPDILSRYTDFRLSTFIGLIDNVCHYLSYTNLGNIIVMRCHTIAFWNKLIHLYLTEPHASRGAVIKLWSIDEGIVYLSRWIGDKGEWLEATSSVGLLQVLCGSLYPGIQIVIFIFLYISSDRKGDKGTCVFVTTDLLYHAVLNKILPLGLLNGF